MWPHSSDALVLRDFSSLLEWVLSVALCALGIVPCSSWGHLSWPQVVCSLLCWLAEDEGSSEASSSLWNLLLPDFFTLCPQLRAATHISLGSLCQNHGLDTVRAGNTCQAHLSWFPCSQGTPVSSVSCCPAQTPSSHTFCLVLKLTWDDKFRSGYSIMARSEVLHMFEHT